MLTFIPLWSMISHEATDNACTEGSYAQCHHCSQTRQSSLRPTLECIEQGVTLSELDTAASLKIRLLATFLFFLCSSVVPNIQSAAVVLIL